MTRPVQRLHIRDCQRRTKAEVIDLALQFLDRIIVDSRRLAQTELLVLDADADDVDRLFERQDRDVARVRAEAVALLTREL